MNSSVKVCHKNDLVFLSVVNHSFNVFLAESALIICNGDTILLASRLVLGRYVQNTVCVQVEGYLDLRNPARSWRNPRQVKFAKLVLKI